MLSPEAMTSLTIAIFCMTIVCFILLVLQLALILPRRKVVSKNIVSLPEQLTLKNVKPSIAEQIVVLSLGLEDLVMSVAHDFCATIEVSTKRDPNLMLIIQLKLSRVEDVNCYQPVVLPLVGIPFRCSEDIDKTFYAPQLYTEWDLYKIDSGEVVVECLTPSDRYPKYSIKVPHLQHRVFAQHPVTNEVSKYVVNICAFAFQLDAEVLSMYADIIAKQDANNKERC